MRHHRTFACAAALLLPLSSSASAQLCSQAIVRGTWGFQGSGTVMMNLPGASTPVPVPTVQLGVVRIDYQGRYTGHGTMSVGGQIQQFDVAGSIQVNPDCSATDTFTAGPSQGAGRYVILDNASEMRAMATKFPLGPAAGIAVYRRISWGEPYCSGDMVRGEYRGSAEGTYMVLMPGQPQPAPMPFSGIFNRTFQHGGTGTAAATASIAGAIVEVEFPNQSIVVNPDCTATVKYTGGVSKQMPGQTFSGAINYIVLNYGNELIGMETESNVGLPVELEHQKRLLMFPLGRHW